MEGTRFKMVVIERPRRIGNTSVFLSAYLAFMSSFVGVKNEKKVFIAKPSK